MAVERKPEFVELANARFIQATQILEELENEFRLEDEKNPADYKKVLSKMLVQFSQDHQATNISGLNLHEQAKIIAGLRLYTRRNIAINILNSVVEATRENQDTAIILKDENDGDDAMWTEISYMFEGPVDKLRQGFDEAKRSGIKIVENILTTTPESKGNKPPRSYSSYTLDETPYFMEESRPTMIDGVTIHERKLKGSSIPFAVVVLVEHI